MENINIAKIIFEKCPICGEDKICIYLKDFAKFGETLLCVHCKNCGLFLAYNKDGQEIIYAKKDIVGGLHLNQPIILDTNETIYLGINPHNTFCERCIYDNCENCPNIDLYSNYSILLSKMKNIKKKFIICEQCNETLSYRFIPITSGEHCFSLQELYCIYEGTNSLDKCLFINHKQQYKQYIPIAFYSKCNNEYC